MTDKRRNKQENELKASAHPGPHSRAPPGGKGPGREDSKTWDFSLKISSVQKSFYSGSSERSETKPTSLGIHTNQRVSGQSLEKT